MSEIDKQQEEVADFERIYAQYQLTYGNELQAKKDRLDGIIGDSHWLSVGTYKEKILRDMLRNRLPARFEVGTGFVLSSHNARRAISKQVDILIWDNEHSPLFRDGDFVIVPPESIRAAIEVKSTLDSKTLREAIENLDSLSKFAPELNDRKVFFRAVFAYGLSKKLIFPDSVFRKLNKFVQTTDMSGFSDKHSDFYPAAWISFVGVLGYGCIEQLSWRLNDEVQQVYFASNTAKGSGSIDSYGVMERRLLMDLTLGYRKDFAGLTHPGFVRTANALRTVPFDGKCYMPFSPAMVSKFFDLDGDENQAWCDRAFYLTRRPKHQSQRPSL